MKTNSISLMYRLQVTLLAIVISCYLTPMAMAQYPGINDSIAKYRKGELIVKAKPGDRIDIEQLGHEFWFGCAIANGMVSGSWTESDVRQYKEKFLENFNSAVTENALKWHDMERNKGEVNYAVVDAMLKWTEENNIPLRGHNIFWGIPRFVQPWIKELDDEELKNTIQRRAETITARYKGRFAEYDLNNEMIHANYYEVRLGPDITRQMVEWSHNGDPDAKLWLNDYDILTGYKLPKFMEHIRTLLAQGAAIAGIGVQGHLHAESFDRGELRRALDSLAIFNLPVRITEFNMPGQRSKFHRERITEMTPEEELQKAKDMVDYYRICFAHPAVEGILMWGFWAGANWIPVSSLYRRDWSPTPAVEAYQDLIFREWWTNESGAAGSDGMLTVPAFYGRYKVTINGRSREVELTRTKGRVIVE